MAINEPTKPSSFWLHIESALQQCRHGSMRLRRVDEIPLAFHEVAIINGYRQPKCTLIDCALSTVRPFNNETINFWTHFVPFWLFLGVLAVHVVTASHTYTHPYTAYLLTVVAWPLASAGAHAFCILSIHARHICFMLDYAALSWYSFGVAIGYHAYSFDRNFMQTTAYEFYPFLAAGAAMFCTFTSCYTRLMSKGKRFWLRKCVRSVGFIVPYVVVNWPLVTRIYYHFTNDVHMPNSILLHLCQFTCTLIAFSFYNSHLPERRWPGQFDLIGQSHQIFHVLGAAATCFQMTAIAKDMYERRIFIEAAHPAAFIRRLGRLDVAMVLGVFVVNLLIVWLISRRLPTYDDPHCEREVDDDDDTCCTPAAPTHTADKHAKQQ